MATIITKNSSTASAAPAAGDLTKGELAVNVTDKKLYTKDNSAAIVKIVGSLGNQEANAVAITGGSIAGITDLAVADGGTGASSAADARTNLGVTATGADTAYAFRSNNLSDLASASTARTNLGLGTIATQAASNVTITGGSVTGITDITVADGGTGASTAANARTNLGLVIGTDVLAPNGSAANLTSFPTLNQNTTGNAATVTTNANLTGAVTSVGNATSLGSFSSSNLAGALTDETGSGSAVFATSPTLVTPILGTPTSATLTNATGLPISTGVSGLGTGVATALAVNVGSSGAPLVNGGVLGTPSSGTATNLTGLPLSTGVTGTLPVANGGTGTATPSIVAGTNVTVTGTWPNQTIAASGGGGGSGDVVGPASSTDNAFARFDSTTGKLLQNSTGATLSDTGAAVFTGALDVLGNSTAGSNIKLYEDTDNGTNYVSFKAPDTIASNVTWTLPSADGTSAQVLSTNGSGTLSWATAGGGSVAGSNTQIQYNNSGAFGASSNFVWDNTNTRLGIGISSPLQQLQLRSQNARIRVEDNRYDSGTIGIEFNNGYLNNTPKTAIMAVAAGGAYGVSDLVFYASPTGDFSWSSTYERMRITSAGVLDIGTGTGAVGQIKFPATQVASSDANTLDDYEEGTWTPAYAPTAGAFTTATYARQYGFYQKVGNTVHLQMYLYLSSFSVGTASGSVVVTGAPFTPVGASEYQAGAVSYTYNWATNNPTKCALYQSDTRIYLFRDAQGAALENSPDIVPANLKNGNPACVLSLAISYRVA